MSWAVKISNQAKDDLDWFRNGDRKIYSKCFDLTLAVLQDPFKGVGKPEPLKNMGWSLAMLAARPGSRGWNVWSRRVSLEHRMVYDVFDSLIVVAA